MGSRFVHSVGSGWGRGVANMSDIISYKEVNLNSNTLLTI